MLRFRVTQITAFAALTLVTTAGDGSAEQKLCISSTGATRVIESEERCRKIETTVTIPDAVEGETIKTSSYVVSGTGGGGWLALSTADRGSSLYFFCRPGDSNIGWKAESFDAKPGDIRTFNDVAGQPFQAFSDLVYGTGIIDAAVVPPRPWTGVFTVKYGKSLSRFELTVSDANARGDCLVTVFSIGLGSAWVGKY